LSKNLKPYPVQNGNLASADLKLDWTYNTVGQATSVTYPTRQQQYSSGIGRLVANMTYDSMARLSGLTSTDIPTYQGDPFPAPVTIASGAVYDARNALTLLNLRGIVESRQYNTIGQLTRIT